MCGIFGYSGPKPERILEGLKALEYRGYDSWGIALKTDNKIKLYKKTGKISEVKNFFNTKSNLGIGHTRWATHGSVSMRNSHPHFDKKKEIFVVHNGIIENYQGLKRIVSEKFYSDTDTEIIPKLIGYYMKIGFLNSVLKVASMLKGNFAFVAINTKSNQIIAVRNGSPLIVGSGSNEFFISSDIPSFLPYTKNAFFLEDGEVVSIEKEKIEFYNFYEKKRVRKQMKHLKLDVSRAMKGNFKHFMLKEINEQPDVIEETMEGYLRGGKFLFKQIKYPKQIKRIIILACGTSWHAALVAEYWLEALAGIPVEVEYASEFRYRDPVIRRGTLVLAITQSGETADTIAAIKEAQKKKAKVLSICNAIGSTITRISDFTLFTRAGPEIGVASTKAFTTQLTILILLSLYLGYYRRKLTKLRVSEFLKALYKIPEQIKLLMDNKDIMKINRKYHSKLNALFLGRGVNYPIALEGALKLKEISYIHAEGYPAAEMKHGPIALIDKNMPTVFIAVKDNSYEKVLSNIEEVKTRKGIVIAIATEGDTRIKKLANNVIYIPKTMNLLTPFLTVIPMQLLAYHIADKKGCEIDKPRNLAKSVTVE